VGCDSLALHLLICQESKVFGAIACPLSSPGIGTGQFTPGKQRFYKVFRLDNSPSAVPLTPSDTALSKSSTYRVGSCKPGISV